MTDETSKVARIGGEEEADASSHSQQLIGIEEYLQEAFSSAASPPCSGDAMEAVAAFAEEVGKATTETERKKKEEERKANERKAKLQKDIELGGVDAVFSLSVMMSGFFLSPEVKGRQTLYLNISMFLAFSSFICGFSLILLSMQLLSAKGDHISGLHRAISRCLFYACSVLPALTILSLLLVMPYRPYIYFGFVVLAVVAVPVSLIHLYVSRKTEEAKATDMEGGAAAGTAPDVNEESQKKEMESGYKITSAIAAMSFAGLVGVLFGVYKGSGGGGGGDISSSVHIVIMCMFSTSMLSMLLMMLWMKVLQSNDPKLRKFFVRTIPRVNGALLVLLAVAAFAASFGILKWYMLSAFVPLALAAIVHFVIQHCCTTQQNVVRAGDNDEMQLKWMAEMATKLTAWSLGIVMAIFGGFLGDDDKTHDKMVTLKICMFFPTTAFASSLGVIYITMRPDGESAARDSSKAAMNILACSAMVLFSAAMLVIYIVEVMKS